MPDLRLEKIERLRDLFAALPSAAARGILSAVEKTDPDLAVLLRLAAGGADDEAARARFFEPLGPIANDPGAAPPSKSLAPPAILEAYWYWIADDLDPEAAAAARDPDLAARAQEDPGLLDAARARVAAKTLATLKAADADPAVHKRVRRTLGVSDFSALETAARILQTAGPLREALSGLPASLPEMSPDLAASIRDRYERACEADPDAGDWVLHYVMVRLTKPWKILRVFERLGGGRRDDSLIARTTMAGVGEGLLADAEHHLAGFSKPPNTMQAAEAAAERLEAFAQITIGMTREFGITKSGPWGRRLIALRSAAAVQLQEIHAQAERLFHAIVPESARSRRGRRPPDAVTLIEAEAAGRFLYLAKANAWGAAADGAHRQTLEGLKTRLDLFGESALTALRESGVAADPGLHGDIDIAARLMTACGEGEAAAILLRRAAAAKAA